MSIKKAFILIIIATLCACENNEIVINENNLLLGSWVEPIYDGKTTTFKRSNSLTEDGYGITFKQDGTFIERSSGWCGTPPLIFSDYEGSFDLDDTLIKIYTEFQLSSFQWRIISISETELTVKRELSEQEQEHRALIDLYNELYELAYSETCQDISDWTFTAFGTKACGGPQGYLPYSTKIDVSSFLQKVDAYSEAENEFNIKWGIASTCDIQTPPNSVECQNGYPVLIY